MAFEVQVGPPQISIHQGQTILISELDGQIKWPSEKGLFFRDTRVVSSWTIYANGEPWVLLSSGATTYYAARIFLTNRAFATEDGTIPTRTLGLTIGRCIGDGMHEDIELTNNSMKPVKFQLEIAIRCDFADLFEVKSNSDRAPRKDHDRMVAGSTAASHNLSQRGFLQSGRDFHRALVGDGNLCQRPSQLRSRSRTGGILAHLPAVLAAGWRRAFERTAQLRR